MRTSSMAQACTFCRIAIGELPAHVVLDEPEVLAFLDRSPLFPGHCLVVPRVHVPTLLDLPENSIAPLFGAAQRIARAIEPALSAEGSFVAMNNKISQSVPHLHVHVVPRRKKDGLRGFFWPRAKYASEDEMERVAEALRAALRSPA
ncbi:HIT family protein [Polyangium sp. y55x31]|uniref:HIT family protein n=1 Tax=Polyangium sp. y55x31 TaxID=3042688 RepID=UPI0024823377|nr:HIT family protein [Polyangium sp. y55x31]MDI1477503.1 HIT family protein [Polyangium sp. y55x31]